MQLLRESLKWLPFLFIYPIAQGLATLIFIALGTYPLSAAISRYPEAGAITILLGMHFSGDMYLGLLLSALIPMVGVRFLGYTFPFKLPFTYYKPMRILAAFWGLSVPIYEITAYHLVQHVPYNLDAKGASWLAGLDALTGALSLTYLAFQRPESQEAIRNQDLATLASSSSDE